MTPIPVSLLNLFNALGPMPPELISEIEENLLFKTIEKKALLVNQGEVCKSIYFIEKGLCRSYYFDYDAEITSWFMKENDLIISVESFFKQQPSNECIEAIETADLYYIMYDKLLHLYSRYHCFSNIGRILTEHYYVMSELRLKNIRKKDALEKYKFLLEFHPHIIQRSPLKYIASYLGIAMETLSRIRGKII